MRARLRLVARRKWPGRSRAQCRFCRRCCRGSGRWGRRLFCSFLGSGLFRRRFLRSSRLLGRCRFLRRRGLLCSSLRCSFLRCSLLRWCGLLCRGCLLSSSLRCSLLGRCGLLGGSSLLSGYFLGRSGLLCRGFFCRSFLCSCHNDLLDQVTKTPHCSIQYGDSKPVGLLIGLRPQLSPRCSEYGINSGRCIWRQHVLNWNA